MFRLALRFKNNCSRLNVGSLSTYTEQRFQNRKKLRFYFYSGWFLLNFLQAVFTQLQEDEAYYWVYSRFPDWGYFDHPPMIGLLVKAGTLILPGELGVRFFLVLLNTLTIYITEKLFSEKNNLLFYAICLSVAALQVAGFWAVPDTPLLFFTALFFLCYRRFIQSSTWANTVWLAVVAACLLYSKYHGVLVIFFTLLANFKIIRQYKIYIAALVAAALYLPHIWWQYQHEWITFKFQFLERNPKAYKINFTLDYLVGQVMAAGPLAGPIILYSSFAYKTKNIFEKVLKFNAVGILLFFLLNSFTRNIQANWTAPALIPMIVLTHNFLLQNFQWKKWLYRLFPATVILVLFARLVMMVDILPSQFVVEKFHAWKKWPQEMKKKTQGLPVVMPNSYQRASLYWFYSGQITLSLSTYEWRRNNYDFWPIEDSLLGKKVFFADIYDLKSFQDSLQTPLWTVGFSPDSNYHSFSKVVITPEKNRYVAKTNEPVTLNISTHIPQHYKTYLQLYPHIDAKIKIGFYDGLKLLKSADCPVTLRQLLQQPDQSITFLPEMPEGEYSFEFAIECFRNMYTHNSYKKKLVIK